MDGGLARMDDRIVISSRVRLARNISGHSFPTWATDDELEGISDNILLSIEGDSRLHDLDRHPWEEVDSLQRALWAEAHMVSPDFVTGGNGRCLMIGPDNETSIMINEEDHLRIQAIYPGSCLGRAAESTDEMDDALEQHLDIAFSEEWGYLTACPTNVGTGMRASVLLHLPALVMTGQALQLFSALAQAGVALRGLFGEGTQAIGNAFQLSNATTLGKSESEVTKDLQNVVDQVVDRERAARKGLLSQSKERLVDRSHRAFGVLTHARMLSFGEAVELMSMVRLGSETGILKTVRASELDRMWMAIRPAHLERIVGRSIDSSEEEALRAETIRQSLSETAGRELR